MKTWSFKISKKALLFLAIVVMTSTTMAVEYDPHQPAELLDHAAYTETISQIEDLNDEMAFYELVDYMERNPHSSFEGSLSGLGREKFKEWSRSHPWALKAQSLFFVDPPKDETSGDRHAEASIEGEDDLFKFDLSFDPLKERARIRLIGKISGHVDLSPDRQALSLDVYEDLASGVSLKFQHLSEAHDSKDVLNLHWKF